MQGHETLTASSTLVRTKYGNAADSDLHAQSMPEDQYRGQCVVTRASTAGAGSSLPPNAQRRGDQLGKALALLPQQVEPGGQGHRVVKGERISKHCTLQIATIVTHCPLHSARPSKERTRRVAQTAIIQGGEEGPRQAARAAHLRCV